VGRIGKIQEKDPVELETLPREYAQFKHFFRPEPSEKMPPTSAKNYPASDTAPLRPLCPVRPKLCPLRPVRSELRPLRPLRPVRPELPGNARSNSMHLEPNQYTTFRPDISVKANLPPVHPDWSINTIAPHDLPLRDARFRGTPEYFLA